MYIQVPFCQTRCTYCNFHTGVVSSARFAPYAAAVQTEIRQHQSRLQAAGIVLPDSFPQEPVDTVYFGGGTPSLLDPQHLHAVLDAIRDTFLHDLREVTLEADPETIDSHKAAGWAAAGINRVSFGVQSFSDLELQAAGRMHRRADIYRVVPILHAAGIRNISFDLIAGLPHQTPGSWRNSLDELIQLAPQHVSIYLLEVDEGSRLGSELLRGGTKYSASAVPSDDAMAESYDQARTTLSAAGYEHYEISNFAKPGFASEHNRKYWRRTPYLGFGAGAHSFSGQQRLGERARCRRLRAINSVRQNSRRASRNNFAVAGPGRRTLPRPSPTRRNRHLDYYKKYTASLWIAVSRRSNHPDWSSARAAWSDSRQSISVFPMKCFVELMR